MRNRSHCSPITTAHKQSKRTIGFCSHPALSRRSPVPRASISPPTSRFAQRRAWPQTRGHRRYRQAYCTNLQVSGKRRIYATRPEGSQRCSRTARRSWWRGQPMPVCSSRGREEYGNPPRRCCPTIRRFPGRCTARQGGVCVGWPWQDPHATRGRS